MTPEKDEFYIGYDGPMPPSAARMVRRVVVAACVVLLAGAALVTVSQRPLAQARFEYGQPRAVTGWLTASPAPSLLVMEDAAWVRYWLVAPGKFGAMPLLADAPFGWVELEGTLVEREPWRLLEVVPGSIKKVPGTILPDVAAGAPRAFDARGEIVDGKCFLGVMNPGERTVHRDCARRCLSGGIPAMFSYRDAEGGHRLALLLMPDGRPAGQTLAAVAGVPVDVRGEIFAMGEADVVVASDVARLAALEGR